MLPYWRAAADAAGTRTVGHALAPRKISLGRGGSRVFTGLLRVNPSFSAKPKLWWQVHFDAHPDMAVACGLPIPAGGLRGPKL